MDAGSGWSQICANPESNSIASTASWGCFQSGVRPGMYRLDESVASTTRLASSGRFSVGFPRTEAGRSTPSRLPWQHLASATNNEPIAMQQFLTRSSLFLLGILAVGGIFFVACDTQAPATSSDPATPRLDGATSGSTENAGSGERQFLVEQGDTSFCVTALSYAPEGDTSTIEQFYDYDDENTFTSNIPTEIEEEQKSILFMYEGPAGTSLVVVHGAPGDLKPGPTYGYASFDFTGLTVGSGSEGWVVQDDGVTQAEFQNADELAPDWEWSEGYTDGGAWRGGLEGSFTVTIDPAFNEAAQRWEEGSHDGHSVTAWEVLSSDASAPQRHPLPALDQRVTISSGCFTEVDIDIKPGSDPNAFNPDGKGTVPVAILNTNDFDPATVDASSVRFGDPEDVDNGGGASVAHDGHAEDVDDDGDDDLVIHFPTEDTGFEGDESEGKLEGQTNGGNTIVGTQSVKLAGGNGSGGPQGGPGGN